ncbi:MAG: hypothetical protein E7320_02205 [Clostridiales bacterium]|nr:hypothetical protein [Clostridiales bacterium]
MWGRFQNADALLGKGGKLLSHNLFAYCGNNPVNYNDPNGFSECKNKPGGFIGFMASVPTTLEGVGFFQVFDLIDGVHELINEVNMMMEGVSHIDGAKQAGKQQVEALAISAAEPVYRLSYDLPSQKIRECI